MGKKYYIKIKFDEIVVEKLMRGEAVKAYGADYREAIRRLAGFGYHDGQIAYLLKKSRGSVLKIRRRWGIPPALKRGRNHFDTIIDAPTRHRSLR